MRLSVIMHLMIHKQQTPSRQLVSTHHHRSPNWMVNATQHVTRHQLQHRGSVARSLEVPGMMPRDFVVPGGPRIAASQLDASPLDQ